METTSCLRVRTCESFRYGLTSHVEVAWPCFMLLYKLIVPALLDVASLTSRPRLTYNWIGSRSCRLLMIFCVPSLKPRRSYDE
jgi:hypothetical protein